MKEPVKSLQLNKMEKLARDVKSLEEQLSLCTRCGMCQSNCPLYAQTSQESDVSRGKLTLICGLIDQMFDDAKGVRDRLDRCLLCGSCAHKCPSRVDTVGIILRTRSIIARYLGLPFTKKLIFKNLLSNPSLFNRLMAAAAPFQKIALRKENNFQGTSCARLVSPLLCHRHMVPLAKTPFGNPLQEMDFREKGRGVTVAFFVGCLIDKAFPQITHSLVEVLAHFKARILIPKDQGCCGIPALAAGDTKTFEKLWAFHVDLFSNQPIDYLVTACATCSSTIIKQWPAVLKRKGGTGHDELLEKAAILAEKTVDISWLLAKRFDLLSPFKGNLCPKEIITCHDPCHLRKSLGVFDQPRQVIKACGHDLREMSSPDKCCGMGGSFNLDHYDLSSRIGGEKALDIMSTGCSTVATSCPACTMQISDMLAQQNARIRVKHPVQIYAEQLNALKIIP